MEDRRAVSWLVVAGITVGVWVGLFPSAVVAFYPPGTLINPPNSSRGQPPPPPSETPPSQPGEQPPAGDTPPSGQNPEPATLITGLLGTGILGLYALVRRRISNQM